MTPEEFRRLALSLRGAVELSHMGHPDFRVNGRIFASLGHPDEASGMVKLTPAQQREWMTRHPGVFEPCSGAWGRAGATHVRLTTARAAMVKPALLAAFDNALTVTLKRRRA